MSATVTPARLSAWPLLSLAFVIVFLTLAFLTASQDNSQDLFIYRAGATLALRGESPYQAGSVRPFLEAHWPADQRLAENAGFFLPPLAIVIFAPFVPLPWIWAKLTWTAVLSFNGIVAGFRLGELFVPSEHARQPLLIRVLIPAAVLLNPVTLAGLVVGQTPLLVLGCIVGGLWLWQTGYGRWAGPLWAIAFLKPHLALPLIPLAWYLGGWKRAATLLFWGVLFTLIGCLFTTGSPLLLRDYLDFITASHKQVAFNRVELNSQITSWNRLLFAAGGPAIDLTATITLAGYAVWAVLVLARSLISGRPPAPWAVAVAAVGALICSQVLGYELVLLALVIPHVIALFESGARSLGWLFVLVLVFVMLPLEAVEAFCPSHRSIGVALLGSLLLIGGWPKSQLLIVSSVSDE